MQYLDMLADFATRDTLTLREMQQAAGRMQRRAATMQQRRALRTGGGRRQ